MTITLNMRAPLLGDRLHGGGYAHRWPASSRLEPVHRRWEVETCWGDANDAAGSRSRLMVGRYSSVPERCFPERMTDNDCPRAGIFVLRRNLARGS